MFQNIQVNIDHAAIGTITIVNPSVRELEITSVAEIISNFPERQLNYHNDLLLYIFGISKDAKLNHLWARIILAAKFTNLREVLFTDKSHRDAFILLLASKLFALHTSSDAALRGFIRFAEPSDKVYAFYREVDVLTIDDKSALIKNLYKSWMQLAEIALPSNKEVLFANIMHHLNYNNKLIQFLRKNGLSLNREKTKQAFAAYYDKLSKQNNGIVNHAIRQNLYNKARAITFSQARFAVNNANELCTKLFDQVFAPASWSEKYGELLLGGLIGVVATITLLEFFRLKNLPVKPKI